MTKSNYNSEKSFILTEKKLAKLHYRIIVGFSIIGIVYYCFIEPKTIGHDNKYTIYIFLLPTVLGMLILGFYRRKFLINRFTTNKSLILWIFMTLSYLLQGLFCSYLSFGQVAKITWDYYNIKKVKKNPEETFNCKITKFWIGKRPSIDFEFNEKHESINVSYSTIKEFENRNVDDYLLKINVSKGLWNYYKLNQWKIEHK